MSSRILLKFRRRLAVLALGAIVSMSWGARVGAAPLPNPLERASAVSPRAAGGVLLSVTAAGQRLVAVGERGIVLLSDDAGLSWKQASVPVSTTLTAVRFIDAKQGWAVGHAGVVLHTLDSGQTWARQLDGRTAAALVLETAAQGSPAYKTAQRLIADGPDKPWLDLHFWDAQRGIVIGAYGLIFGTQDGGATWTPWLDRLDNPKALHLNALAVRGNSLLIAGEQGLLLHSSDAGGHFTRLSSPYEGSWFAAAALPASAASSSSSASAAPRRWLIAGLRGKAFGWDEASGRFTPAELPIPVSLSALSVLGDGRVIALNQAGQAFISADGQRFQIFDVPPGAPLTAVVEAGPGRLIGASLRGLRPIGAVAKTAAKNPP